MGRYLAGQGDVMYREPVARTLLPACLRLMQNEGICPQHFLAKLE